MLRIASAGSLSIDVDRDIHTTVPINGDKEKIKAYNMVTGQIGSYLEGGVFRQMFRDLINSGKEITVPEENVTIGSWTGTGYVAFNPDDGTGAYMIDGGLSGGFFDDHPYLKEIFLAILSGVYILFENVGPFLSLIFFGIDLNTALSRPYYWGEIGGYIWGIDFLCLLLEVASLTIGLIALIPSAGLVGFALGFGIFVLVTVLILRLIQNYYITLYEEQYSYIQLNNIVKSKKLKIA